MKWLSWILAIAAVAPATLAFAAAPKSPAASEGRTYKNGVFQSRSLPAIQIEIPKEYEYLGNTAFELTGEANVDRHHFVDGDSAGEMRRAIILHFEGFLPDVDQTYNYRIPKPEFRAGPDARFSDDFIRLGDADYIHNTWFFDAAQNIRENPDRELARSARLFKEHGYRLPDELMMSRFVRVVDEARKHEFILFYLEPLAKTGLRAASFVEGGAGAAVFDSLSAGITERSRNAFRVLEPRK